ncbi:MAG TPA: adenylate/guanylate cyclase domain-containing protein [Polyangiaceae bacterium]|nr:adenylate/guanylate cyclase domain-containing protein [Polyangiaceae bacterium]
MEPTKGRADMPATPEEFARGVLDGYRGLSDLGEKSLLASGYVSLAKAHEARSTGHPSFANLPVGATSHCDAAVVFFDLTNFTSRSFWDPPDSVVRLARAVLTQLIEVVHDFGGHVLGLRGDGVFSCFGGPESVTSAVDVAGALGACAWAMDAVQGALNNLLALDGLEPVQLRAGADYGRLDFCNTGAGEVNEVNVLGFAANFAAKCEKTAASWEVVVGEELARRVSNPALISEHADSPKTYQRNYEQRMYRFFDLRWQSIVPHANGVREDLNGHPISSVRLI